VVDVDTEAQRRGTGRAAFGIQRVTRSRHVLQPSGFHEGKPADPVSWSLRRF
jgi:hypothetical protein